MTVKHVKKLDDFEIDYQIKTELIELHKDNIDLKTQEENYRFEYEE